MSPKNQAHHQLPLPENPLASHQPFPQQTPQQQQQQQLFFQQQNAYQQQQYQQQQQPFPQQVHHPHQRPFQQQQQQYQPSIQSLDIVPLRELTRYSAPVRCPKCLHDGPTVINAVSTTTPEKKTYMLFCCLVDWVPQMTSRSFEHACKGCGALLAKYHVKEQPDIPGYAPMLDIGTTEVVAYAGGDGGVVGVQPRGYPGMVAT